jgi:hypothetical protein
LFVLIFSPFRRFPKGREIARRAYMIIFEIQNLGKLTDALTCVVCFANRQKGEIVVSSNSPFSLFD